MNTQPEMERLYHQIVDLKRQMSELRRSLPPQPVGAYTFETSGEAVSLIQLFGGKKDLLVVHNMGRDCRYCTLWADGLNGLVPALETRTAVALCSPDPPAVQAAFAQSRGWRFRMISDPTHRFTQDMGYWSPEHGSLPGVSAFHKSPEGLIARVAHTPFGPGDDFCAAWPLLDLLADGPAGWEPGP
jgi:predicted dithiol-disulfide oxidoreductase (DUF899 family)